MDIGRDSNMYESYVWLPNSKCVCAHVGVGGCECVRECMCVEGGACTSVSQYMTTYTHSMQSLTPSTP